jgi:hypothetical protein
LALCDRTTVEESDWETAEKIHTNWIEESMYLRYNNQHKWYWLSNQTMDEVTCMVVWDSERADQKTGRSTLPRSQEDADNEIQEVFLTVLFGGRLLRDPHNQEKVSRHDICFGPLSK